MWLVGSGCGATETEPVEREGGVVEDAASSVEDEEMDGGQEVEGPEDTGVALTAEEMLECQRTANPYGDSWPCVASDGSGQVCCPLSVGDLGSCSGAIVGGSTAAERDGDWYWGTCEQWGADAVAHVVDTRMDSHGCWYYEVELVDYCNFGWDEPDAGEEVGVGEEDDVGGDIVDE